MPIFFTIYITTILIVTILLRPGDSVPLSFSANLVKHDRKLVCLCNDNNHCIANKPRLRHFASTNITVNLAGTVGRCETSHSGRCYTVKEVNLDSLKSGKTHRKRKSLLNESTSPLVLLTSHSFTSNISAADLQNLALDKFIRVRFGCLPSDERTTLTCNGHLSNHMMPKAILCCNSSDFCNFDAVPNFHHYKTDFDAITSALQNYNNRRTDNYKKRLHLNPVMNIGPELLSGGKPIKKSISQAHSKAHTAQDYPKVTRIVFIVAFVLVVGTLIAALTCVFVVYKSGVRKHRQMMYNSVRWNPNRSPNKSQTHLSSKINVLTNNGLSVRSSESYASKDKVYTEHIVGNGPSVHTLSTESTRTTNTANEKPYSSGFCYDFAQQTLSKQVSFNRLLGCGRFSEVWSGSWRGEPVTAKLYPTHSRLADSIWRRVALLHRSMLLRHQSIQGLMAIDSISWSHQLPAPGQRVMMIAEWIPLGSLKDLMANYCWSLETRPFLLSEQGSCFCDCGSVRLVRRSDGANAFGEDSPPIAVDAQSFFAVLLRMAHSLTQGLCFLHTEFAGTRGKPALAHRDLKPANVLIRSDWTCCLADLGLAVRPPPASLPVSQPDLHRLYSHYVGQMLHSADPPQDMPSQRVDCSPRQDTNQYADSCVDQPTLAGLSLEEAEQLDWWPIGGVQTGTPRYSAPELLSDSIDPFCFTAHQKADVYALGLIMWELFTWTLSTCQHRLVGALGGDSTNEASQPTSDPSVPLIAQPTAHRCDVTSNPAIPVRPVPSPTWPPHRPVFQEEWQRYLSQTCADSQAVCDWCRDGTTSCMPTEASAQEPGVLEMRHLVCTLRLRPQQPLPPAWLDCHRTNKRQSCPLDQQQRRETEDDQGIELASEGDSERPQSVAQQPSGGTNSRYRHVSSAITTHQVPSTSCSTTHSSSSSSSSGASSLIGPFTGSTSSNDSEPRHPVRSDHRLGRAITQLTAVLPECWSHNPDARLTALRVRKNLQRISDQLQTQPVQQRVEQGASQQTTTALVLQSPNANIQQCSNSSSSNTIKAF